MVKALDFGERLGGLWAMKRVVALERGVCCSRVIMALSCSDRAGPLPFN